MKKGNNEGIKEFIQIFKEYDIVLKINNLFKNISIMVIIHNSIIIVFINFVFIFNYIKRGCFYV